MRGISKEVIKYVTSWLSTRNKRVSKVVLHKVLFYLSESKLPIYYHFEPQTYGPFSRQLARDLDEMVFWDEMEQDGNCFTLPEKGLVGLPRDMMDNLESQLDLFDKIVGGDYSFDSMEITGTLLYCMRALKAINENIDFDSVYKEFAAWKGEKYPEDHIKAAYDNIVLLSA